MSEIDLIEYGDIAAQAWARLTAAADDRAHPMRLMTVATLDEQLRPSARLMVLRGASDTLNALWFHTDCRSHKAAQLRARPPICAVCYDPRDGVQLRVDGEATIHSDDALVDSHWDQVNMALRLAYGRPAPPGSPSPHVDPQMQQLRRDHKSGHVQSGRMNFCVIEVNASRIDWLQVRGAEQRRAVLRASNAWMAEALVP